MVIFENNLVYFVVECPNHIVAVYLIIICEGLDINKMED